MADDLTRRAIIAAHDAECDCGDIPSDNSEWTLTDREQAIVAAWRADAERHSIVTGIADKQGARILGERNEALAAIERVRNICAWVPYKVPGDSDSYGAYPEGRSDMAGEVLAALDGEAAG